jgi:hypothetical protein
VKTARGKPGIGMVTSSGLPWVAKRIREAARWISEGKDYAPATVVRMLRESRGNMQEFWYAWSELLDIACDKFDWSQPVVIDSDDREQYESGADFYRREVEPFLGPLERLREVAGRYRIGEITHDEGREQLRPKAIVRAVEAKQAADAAGVKLTTRQLAAVAECSIGTASDAVQKSSSLPQNRTAASAESAANGLSKATIYRQRRLKADHPDLWAQVEAGEKSTHAAAIQAGIVKVPSVLEQLRKLWAKATDADRQAFMDEVGHGR